MSPYERMREEYLKRPQAQTFEWYVMMHLCYGFVFSTPDYFVMGVPTTKALLESKADPLAAISNKADCDCWYIFSMSGDMAEAWKHLPWETPWLGYERDLGGVKELRFLPLATIRGKAAAHL